MKTVIIIPSRMESKRLPGKPLIEIDGIPMIQRVVAQAKKVKNCDKVVVATDSEQIAFTLSGRCEVIRTSPDPKTGTDRCAEAARIMGLSYADCVINFQGDMPFAPPELCEDLIRFLKRDKFPMVTPYIKRSGTFPRAVHVIPCHGDQAMFFARLPLETTGPSLHHIGMYGFKNIVLQRFAAHPQPSIEIKEGLEQLRALYYRIQIGIMQTVIDCGREINYEADLKG